MNARDLLQITFKRENHTQTMDIKDIKLKKFSRIDYYRMLVQIQVPSEGKDFSLDI